MWFICTVCLFTQKDVSFPNRNQLYPLIILHVQCGLCVQYVYLHKRDVSFPNRNQLYPLIILHVQCGLCVQYVYLHKRAYHSQIEIKHILSSSCTEFNCRGANATGWRHYRETFAALLARCEREFAGHQWCSDLMSPLMSDRTNYWWNTEKQVNWCGLTLIWRHCIEKWNS